MGYWGGGVDDLPCNPSQGAVLNLPRAYSPKSHRTEAKGAKHSAEASKVRARRAEKARMVDYTIFRGG